MLKWKDIHILIDKSGFILDQSFDNLLHESLTHFDTLQKFSSKLSSGDGEFDPVSKKNLFGNSIKMIF